MFDILEYFMTFLLRQLDMRPKKSWATGVLRSVTVI